MVREIKIGKKAVMCYILAINNSIKAGEKEIVLLSRGKSVSKCIDVLEILKDSIKLKKSNLKSKTVSFENNNKVYNISVLEIKLEVEENK